ncbi:ABC transporter substrate-binding protein [Frankia sp. CNm7]|uniref:ABC transporter substrate-binding protein n=1 Tax=Frankia nepalensis TaxID=1836974 RepID=UPI0019319FA1|nr:ABC transporter substrate-binding protein [Frankia nepalensis]MBL7520990.1 ABC transporter substrate-binding protein [Frankia nepalensis]
MGQTGISGDGREARPGWRRPSRRHGSALAALSAFTAVSVLLAGWGGDDEQDTPAGTPSAAASAADVLGPVAAAQGAPVRIGLISDGKGPVSDLAYEKDVAAAAAKFLNERRSGIGGRPIELVSCETLADPGKGADCANRMIEEDVVAVVVGSSSVVESIWHPLHDAHVPTLFGTAPTPALLADAESTFILSDSIFPLIKLPMQLAKENGENKVTVVAIDVPTVMGIYQSIAPRMFEAEGMELDVVAVPPGTADMTPQMQTLVAGGPGLVQVLGSDAFCIAAFNGLRTAGFSGPLAAVAQCITDATRKSVPGDTLEGITMSASAPIGTDNPSTELLAAVAETYGNGEFEVQRQGSLTMFTTVTALQAATKGISGEITPAAMTAAIKAMPESELPGAGGLKFRCGGKANPSSPAVCVRGGLVTTLDGKGQPTEYRVLASTPIEG